jgi:hypothetical protein
MVCLWIHFIRVAVNFVYSYTYRFYMLELIGKAQLTLSSLLAQQQRD